MAKQDRKMIAAANKKALLKARREFAKLKAEIARNLFLVEKQKNRPTRMRL